MALPDVDLCRNLSIDIDIDLLASLGITLPGGADLSVNIEVGTIPDLSIVVSDLIARINAALTPMVPIFRLIEICIQLFECLKSVVDALLPPDPSLPLRCLAQLAAKIDIILQLIPPLQVPIFVKAVLTLVIKLLVELYAQIENILTLQVDIDLGKAKAIELDAQLMMENLSCAQGNLDLQFEALSKSMIPLASFIGLLNVFMEMGGLEPIPTAGTLGTDPSAALEPLADIIKALEDVVDSLPG